jgi:hypothetical protein
MSTDKRGTRYDEDFKRFLVNLYQNGGETQATDCHLHTTLEQQLDAIHKLRFQHDVKIPCKTLVVKCFFKYLKKEETNRKTYHSVQELKLSVFDYIEGFYNSRRPHGSFGMLTPNEKGNFFWNQS